MTMHDATQRRGLFARLNADPGAEPRAIHGADPRAIHGPEPRAIHGADPRAIHGPDPRAIHGELELVLANLRLLFNTRPGDAAAAPDFGVPDLADLLHQFPAASGPLQQALRAAIARHEPRLRGVQITPAPSGHALEISAQLDGVALRLRAVFTPSGRIDLR